MSIRNICVLERDLNGGLSSVPSIQLTLNPSSFFSFEKASNPQTWLMGLPGVLASSRYASASNHLASFTALITGSSQRSSNVLTGCIFIVDLKSTGQHC